MAEVVVLSWNLFHGRDKPAPGGTDVNRSLAREFAGVVAGERWDVALLQEAPPHWLRPLCEATGASGASALTSRNLGAFLRREIAARNPDWIKSGEGGSNQVLARGGWRIVDTRRLTLTLWPERRRLIWTRLAHAEVGPLAIANLHATADDRPAATRDVVRAARAACAWSAEVPLVFGGDFNLRMSETPAAFDRFREEFGLTGARPGRAIDHLLTRGLEVARPPEPLPPERREVAGVRLSDHTPVVASYELRSRASTNGGA